MSLNFLCQPGGGALAFFRDLRPREMAACPRLWCQDRFLVLPLLRKAGSITSPSRGFLPSHFFKFLMLPVLFLLFHWLLFFYPLFIFCGSVLPFFSLHTQPHAPWLTSSICTVIATTYIQLPNGHAPLDRQWAFQWQTAPRAKQYLFAQTGYSFCISSLG